MIRPKYSSVAEAVGHALFEIRHGPTVWETTSKPLRKVFEKTGEAMISSLTEKGVAVSFNPMVRE